MHYKVIWQNFVRGYLFFKTSYCLQNWFSFSKKQDHNCIKSFPLFIDLFRFFIVSWLNFDHLGLKQQPIYSFSWFCESGIWVETQFINSSVLYSINWCHSKGILQAANLEDPKLFYSIVWFLGGHIWNTGYLSLSMYPHDPSMWSF